jgi:hypothetical protein
MDVLQIEAKHQVTKIQKYASFLPTVIDIYLTIN